MCHMQPTPFGPERAGGQAEVKKTQRDAKLELHTAKRITLNQHVGHSLAAPSKCMARWRAFQPKQTRVHTHHATHHAQPLDAMHDSQSLLSTGSTPQAEKTPTAALASTHNRTAHMVTGLCMRADEREREKAAS